MVLYILVFFALMSPGIVYLSLNHYRGAVEQSVEEQQFMLVSRIAEELDQKMIFSQDALISAARRVTAKIVSDPARSEDFLDNNLALLSIFDNGVFLFGPDGRMIAETTQRPSRTGMDFSYREYMIRTVATRKSVISPPFVSSMSHHHPAIMFTVPIFGDNGRLIAVFAGSIDLMKPNFLGSLAQAKIGKDGYFHLTTKDRIVIMHPVKNSIMTAFPPGREWLYDKAVQGFEGSGESIDTSGMHMISAFRKLKTVDWILAANYPEREALAPIRRANYLAWSLVLLGGVMIGGVLWLIMKQLIAPLISFTDQIRTIHSEDHHDRQVEVSTNDEIRELATVFNSLMSGLDEKERRLREINELLEIRVAERTAQLEATNRMLQVEIRNRAEAQEEIICLNEDLNRRALSLETINKELESFSYSVSHDLRAPVRHIKSFINILMEDHADKLDTEAELLLRRISDAGGKLEILINEILNLSKVSRAEINHLPVNLSALATDIAELLKETEPVRNVSFEIEDDVVVTGDPALMHMVMQNLMENAWKYSAKNDKSVIRIGTAVRDNEKTCFVKDNGIGFDMAYAEKMFGVFQRLHDASEFEGTGIGLATVQRIIHRHGGRVWAEAAEGKGATFFFTVGE
ncbi:GHKL domain-containing protein [Geobacter pelophilus]|uniref:histidine kinase n=1 Tax=Geoanaerobacter pelophilus TaxID=60036 RepID=A0AAW4L4G7_9BACT|nr:ATP-binding protein [Geoanaerobacter pelophilus]MBT0666094.1 GHKL domain-containing protein [Geoanaerobacter pelophilus]